LRPHNAETKNLYLYQSIYSDIFLRRDQPSHIRGGEEVENRLAAPPIVNEVLDRPGGAVSETCGFWDVNPQLQGAFCHNRLKIGHTERASEREEDQYYKEILLIGGEMVEP